jgi:hypothetical protein
VYCHSSFETSSHMKALPRMVYSQLPTVLRGVIKEFGLSNPDVCLLTET